MIEYNIYYQRRRKERMLIIIVCILVNIVQSLPPPDFFLNDPSAVQSPQLNPAQILQEGNSSLFDNISYLGKQIELTFCQIDISLTLDKEELTKEILLISDLQFEDWMSAQLSQNIEVYFKEQLQKHIIAPNSEGMLIISIQVNNSSISGIQVKAKNFVYNNQIIEVNFILNQHEVYFNMLNKNQIKIIEDIAPIAEDISNIVHEASTIIILSFSSYLVLNLINFWNLSLLYIFLNIGSVPEFSQDIFKTIMHLIYQKRSMINLITTSFDLPDQNFDLEFQKQLSEHMSSSDYAKFKEFGFSSKLFLNNLDRFLIFGLLIVKLLVIKIILSCIPSTIKQQLQIQCNYKIIIVSQVIAITPFLLISGFVTVNNSYDVWPEKIEKLAQLMLFFISLAILPLWFLGEYWEINAIKKKITNNIKNNQQIRKSTISQTIIHWNNQLWRRQLKVKEVLMKYKFLQLTFLISIPLLMIACNIALFMSVNSIILIGRIMYLIKNADLMRIIDRIFAIIMTLIWTLHHYAFLLLYVTSQYHIYQESNSHLGIILIISIITGGIVEFLRLLCSLSILVFTTVKKLKRICRCCNKHEISVEKTEGKKQQNKKQQNKKEQDKKKQAAVKFNIAVKNGTTFIGNRISNSYYNNIIPTDEISKIMSKSKKKTKYIKKEHEMPVGLECKFNREAPL